MIIYLRLVLLQGFSHL